MARIGGDLVTRRLAAVAMSLALAAAACTSPTLRSAPTTPSPLGSGSAAATVAGTPPVSSASTSSGAAPPKPATVVRNVSPRPGSDDGLIVLTRRVCGTSASWVSQANANHIAGPAYVVADSARLTIDCSLPAIAPAAQPAPAAVPATSTKPQPAVAASAKTTAGWVAPLPGRCDPTDDFGAPRYNPATGQHYSHQGRDLPAPTGTPIHAITAGTIISAHDIGRGGLQVQLQAGTMTAKFNHLSGFAVHVGQHVSAGQIIGYVGMTGDAIVPHLHLEIWVSGALRNPTTFLAGHGIRLGC